MAFVKLDCGILNSALWFDLDARAIFLTALLMAVPYELTDEMEQMEVRTLEKTGFVVPPGWYGFVPAAGIGIVRQAGIKPRAGMSALERLGQPEAESRTPDFEGRRLVRVNGGYLLLNYDKYRQKDHTAAERQSRFRDKKAKEKAFGIKSDDDDPKKNNAVTSISNAVTTRYITQAEAEAEAEAEIPNSSCSDLRDVVDAWNKSGFPKVKHLTQERKKHLRARLQSPFWLENWRDALNRISQSDFCRGRVPPTPQRPKPWIADFDWFIRSDSAVTKALEGTYDGQPAASITREIQLEPHQTF